MGSVISLELSAVTVVEDEGFVIVPVVRTGDSSRAASFDYSVTDSSAVAVEDFIASADRLTFTSGQTRLEIQIPIVDNNRAEIDERFNIQIGEPSAGDELGFIRSAFITIEDDDSDGNNAIRFSAAEYSTLENSGSAIITVTRSGNGAQVASVEYFSTDASARAGSDYTTTIGTLNFSAGETSKSFTVPIANDDLFEVKESLNLGLRNPVGATLGAQSQASLKIEEEDTSPHQFEEKIILSGLDAGSDAPFSPPGPTVLDWAPDGTMFIAKLDGIVLLYDGDNLLPEPFIDISAQVNTGGQRGLLGFAVDPNFSPTSPYVYLAFSYDPPGVTPDQSDVPRVTRVVRVSADPATNYKTALPNSEVLLLETSLVDNFHAAGELKFGSDGALYFSHGDGQAVGTTTGVQKAELLSSLDNPFGKLLRIDPATGQGLADNPFYLPGDPDNIQSKVYNYGLRNPWRYTLHPETDEPFIGDVGQSTWEEINRGAGHYFGWSLYEGGNGESLRSSSIANRSAFQDLYNEFDSKVVAPIYAENHADGARAIVMGDFYTGTTFPDVYQGALLFAEFGNGDVKALTFDEQGELNSAIPVLESSRGLSYMTMGPDGKFYFANIIKGEVGVWSYVGGDDNPGGPIDPPDEPTDPDPGTPIDSLKFEAEDLTATTGYRIENNAAASGGKMLSLVRQGDDEIGTASFTFGGDSGKYNISLGTFDESDGEASFELQRGTQLLGSFTLDQGSSINFAGNASKVERTIAQSIDVSSGDRFTITGFEQRSEHARLDFIQFDLIEAGGPSNNIVSITTTQNAAEPTTNGQFRVSLSQVAVTDTVVSLSIAGSATAGDDYIALGQTVTIPAGELSVTLDVAVNDDLEIESAESIAVTLTAIAGGDANLVLGTSNVATVTIADNEVANELSIAASINASEPATNGQFTVALEQVAAEDTVVRYSVGGTAEAGADYNALAGTVTIPAGQRSSQINVAVIDDQAVEGLETVSVTLDTIQASEANVVFGTATSAIVNIVDDDVPLASLTIEAEDIANVSGYRLERKSVASGGQLLSLVKGASEEIGTATFAFSGGSGQYNVVLGTFDENDGQASLVVTHETSELGTVLLNRDPGGNAASANTKVERTVAMGVSISNGDAFTITGIEEQDEHARFDFIRFEPIAGDPTPPVDDEIKVSILSSSNATEPNQNGQFSVLLSQPSASATTVSYGVSGSADAGDDYDALAGTVTIPAGQQTAVIDVVVQDDTTIEGSETVVVRLNSVTDGASNVSLGSGRQASLAIADDDFLVNPPPASVIKLEAEDVLATVAGALVQNYAVETTGVASNGKLLSLLGEDLEQPGVITIPVDGLTGFVDGIAYDISLGAFDEGDGAASFTLQRNQASIGSVDLDQPGGRWGPAASNFVELGIASGQILETGDVLTIKAFDNANEFARLDFIQLSPLVSSN